jgi:hypothetical protein
VSEIVEEVLFLSYIVRNSYEIGLFTNRQNAGNRIVKTSIDSLLTIGNNNDLVTESISE